MSTTGQSILVIEDEPQMLRFLRTGLEMAGFDVGEASTGADGLRLQAVKPFDIVIVDLGLPDMDGKRVIEDLRSWSRVPIIALSVRSQEEEKVRVLDLGADDYVVKPFSMPELLARTRAGLRRQVATVGQQPVLKIGELVIDLANRLVELNGERVQLTPKEYKMLQILAQYAGKVVTQQQLLRDIWGIAHDEDAHYLRILVRKIRQKIEADPTRPKIVLTELGVGYRLARPRDSEA